MYLIGDVSEGEREHVRECAVCRAELSRLETSLASFRGAVRQWSGEPVARAHDALAWTLPADLDHYEMPPADGPLLASLKAWTK